MKFYKITNEQETHKGMKYKTGLNVDVLPFNPSGTCQPGGIYFSREDILSFLYGPWIREVVIPEGEEVYLDPSNPKKWKAHKVILKPRKKINLEVIKSLVKEGANIRPFDDNYRFFFWACRNGHLDVIKYMVSKGVDLHADGEYAFQWAAENGNLDIVKFLVSKGSNIHVCHENAFQQASRNGHLAVVKYLVSKGADIHADNDLAFQWAAENGNLDVVKYLKSLK